MTNMEMLAVQVFFGACELAKNNNCFDAYDKCDELLSLIDDFKNEIKSYQDFLERACDQQIP